VDGGNTSIWGIQVMLLAKLTGIPTTYSISFFRDAHSEDTRKQIEKKLGTNISKIWGYLF